MARMTPASTPADGAASVTHTFVHITSRNDCKHDFKSWREFDDGCGGEQVCAKCGIGAMAHTLSLDI